MPTATEEEIYRILVQVEGQKKLADLTAELSKQEKQLAELIKSHKSHGATAAQVFQATQGHASSIAALNKEIKATKDLLESNAGSAKRAGQALMQLGYAADDVQYGLKGIANNIQPLLSSFGMGAGLAGALSIAAIAAVQLYNHWDDLMDVMGMGRVRTEAEEMEALGKKTEKTAAEFEKLLKYQRQQGIIDTQRKGLTSAESAQEKAVNAAVAEGGGDDVVKGLARIRQLDDPRMKRIDDDEAKYEAYVRGAGKTVSQATRDRFQKRRDALAEQQDKEARAELARAAMDPSALQGLLNKVTSNPGAFGPNAGALASGLAQALPENMAAERENARIGRKAEQAKAEREKEERDKDIEQDYEWEKLQESNRRWKQSQQEKKRRVADNVQNAKRQDPNLGDMLSTLIYTAAKQGGPEAANAAQVGLIDQLTARYGKDVATKLVAESASNAKEKYVGEMIKPGKERNSEVMDGASYARAVQAGVSNKDTPEKQLRTLQAIHEQLKRIASMNDNTLK